MRYVSTRGAWAKSPRPFREILLEGLAPDGGLAVPHSYPRCTATELAAMRGPDDRALAEPAHAAITSNAPDLEPKPWYSMPAYANADGKVVVFFQDSGKFKYRFSTLGFQDAANLDDGDFWPTSYAMLKWSPKVEQQVVALVEAAVS